MAKSTRRKTIGRESTATTEEPGASAAAVPPLGDRIRRLRHHRHWSLSELGRRAGIATSTLSKVENGLLSLAYDRLLAVATAFGMSLSAFLASGGAEEEQPVPIARISWARRNSGEFLEIGSYTYEYLCTNLRKKRMVPLIGQVHAHTLEEFGPLVKHEGEEFLFVLKGRVAVHTEFYTPEVLDEMEGVYLDSRMGHAAVNAGPGEAWILSVNTDPKWWPIPEDRAGAQKTRRPRKTGARALRPVR